jgi:hypothetical protein
MPQWKLAGDTQAGKWRLDTSRCWWQPQDRHVALLTVENPVVETALSPLAGVEFVGYVLILKVASAASGSAKKKVAGGAWKRQLIWNRRVNECITASPERL